MNGTVYGENEGRGEVEPGRVRMVTVKPPTRRARTMWVPRLPVPYLGSRKGVVRSLSGLAGAD